MTLLLADSFETYNDSSELSQVFPGSSNNGSITFVTGRRAGTKALLWDAGWTSANIYFPINVDTFAVDEYAILGFAFKSNTIGGSFPNNIFFNNDNQGGTLVEFLPGATNIKVSKITVGYQEIDTFSYVDLETWHYFEIKTKIGNGTDGVIIVRLDEQEIINWTGDNLYLGNSKIDNMRLELRADWDIEFDDLYLCKSGGSYNNDFLGDVRIDVIHPNGAGNYTDFTPSVGSNYQCIDETLIDESDYVEGANVGDKDSYSYPDVPIDLDDAGIFAIDIRNISQRTAAFDNIKIDGFVRTGSTDYNASIDFSLPDSWYAKDFIFERDPSDSNPWTQAKINACEFGVEVV